MKVNSACADVGDDETVCIDLAVAEMPMKRQNVSEQLSSCGECQLHQYLSVFQFPIVEERNKPVALQKKSAGGAASRNCEVLSTKPQTGNHHGLRHRQQKSTNAVSKMAKVRPFNNLKLSQNDVSFDT